eukprot:5929783-Pleurochrysis_carterae.AAC.3
MKVVPIQIPSAALCSSFTNRGRFMTQRSLPRGGTAAAFVRARKKAFRFVHHFHPGLSALNTATVSEQPINEVKLEAVIARKKPEECKLLSDCLLAQCDALTIGILKKTCTAVASSQAAAKFGVGSGFLAAVEDVLKFQFNVADEEEKANAAASKGGIRAKHFCQKKKTAGAQLCEAGLA